MSITTAARNPYAGTLALTALTPIVWGSTYAVTTEFLPPDRPLFTALMRALPAGLVLLALTRTLPRGMWVGRAAALGVLNIGAFFPLLFLAAYRLPGGVAGVLGAVAPMFALVFATGVLNERPTGRKVLAGVIGVFGVALVVLRATAQLDTIGVIAGLVGAASMALGTVLTKRWGRPEGVGPLAMTGWQLTAGGLFILPLAALIEGAPPAMDGRAVGGYLYLGVIGTAAAYWLWLRGIAKVPATSVAFLGLLSPVSAAVIGWVALGEALTGLQILGMVIALGGTLLGQTTARVRAAKISVPAESGPTAELGGAVPGDRGVSEVGRAAEVGVDKVDVSVELGAADQPVELGAADQPVEVGAADQPGLGAEVGGAETVGDVLTEDSEKDGRTTGDSRMLVGAKS
ncbi:probable blue pigment (indigoidine) exporter [Nocardia amikacinitolerans]|uniref:Probable blue pigment (Indigoidine) exporter n=1 Tax=Nocardia amikacinitolerans TaxID=756689 RepID=A0A285LQK7_9NOCA|nr:DMT family transporter [Nocardia amikacinitolerans]SNY87189.1 probable blue pigment (indigoidine) exporter [Nocardia amikacinitolerans]